MSFSTKWHLRQISLDLLSVILCFTTLFVIAPIIIDFKELFELGFNAYPNFKLERLKPSPAYVAQVFWYISVWPMMKWLPLTICGDLILRRFVYRLKD